VAQLECPHRPFRLDQVESWPECLEILIEGELDLPATEILRGTLERALDADRLFGATDLVRRKIEGIHAFDDRVLLPTAGGR
jgi:hypothetical protein